MNQAYEFRQYRGDGTTRTGKQVSAPPKEKGRYLAHPNLVAAVNAAIAVEQPLLVTGEAGTGKTALAYSIAAELGHELVEFAVRSDHQGRDLLYEFDNLQRFYDAQVGDKRASEREKYLRLGVLGKAFRSKERMVVLIDEIDKAPRDFPNDLLGALDRMELRIPELDDKVDPAVHRPIVVITSNRESQLPDPFLRRCVFHHIEFPERPELLKILDERLRHLEIVQRLRERIVDRFLLLRKVDGLLKKPTTSEMLVWARVLHQARVTEDQLEGENTNLPFLGTLFKVHEDLDRVRDRR